MEETLETLAGDHQEASLAPVQLKMVQVSSRELRQTQERPIQETQVQQELATFLGHLEELKRRVPVSKRVIKAGTTPGYGFFSKGAGGGTTGTSGSSYGFFGNKQGTAGAPNYSHREFFTGGSLAGQGAASSNAGASWFSSNPTAQQKEQMQKYQAAAAESSLNQARIILDLQELRPFGEHLLPRHRTIKMEDERELDPKGNRKGAYLEAQPYKMFYTDVARQIDLLRSVPNPLNNKVVSSFSQEYQAMILSLNKTILGSGTQLQRIANLNKEIREGIQTKLEKRCDQFLVKMRVIANKLELIKSKARLMDDYIAFLLRCSTNFKNFYDDLRADRDLTLELPSTELSDIANYLSLMTVDLRKELDDILEIAEKSKDEEMSIDYMNIFGETIDALFTYISVIIPRAVGLRERISKVMVDTLGRQPVDTTKPKTTAVNKIQYAGDVRNRQLNK